VVREKRGEGGEARAGVVKPRPDEAWVGVRLVRARVRMAHQAGGFVECPGAERQDSEVDALGYRGAMFAAVYSSQGSPKASR
jgi:hypothetical protein